MGWRLYLVRDLEERRPVDAGLYGQHAAASWRRTYEGLTYSLAQLEGLSALVVDRDDLGFALIKDADGRTCCRIEFCDLIGMLAAHCGVQLEGPDE